MKRWRAHLLAAMAVGVTSTLPASAAAYDDAFASAFAETCLPGRLGYESTQQAALAAGWVEIDRTDSAVLDAILARSETELADPELPGEMDYRAYARDILGTRHHLVVNRTSIIVSDPEDPWVTVGCYLYNFAATAPLDPAPISAILQGELSATREQDGVVSRIWGPTCPFPRSGDTYLNYVADSSPMAAELGFAGIALTFTTSEPDPGETVPETYC